MSNLSKLPPITDVLAPQIAEELKAIIVERWKNAQEEALRMYWECGQTLREHESRGNGINELVHGVALALDMKGWSERTLWNCVKIYDDYPVFEDVYKTEHGQSVTIRKLVTKTPARKDDRPECNHKCRRHCSPI